MPITVRKWGQTFSRPGVYTHHNLDGLLNLDLGEDGAVMVIGEATAGKPMATYAAPVVHSFTDPQDMIDYFQHGNLAEMARSLFRPAKDGQFSEGVPIGGARIVYAIKTNQSTQASYTLQDGSSNDAVTLKDRYWGLLGNQTWFKVEVSGTGIVLTTGRDADPDIGEQESIVFAVSGTDEAFTIAKTAAFTGTSVTYDFNVAVAGTITINSDVATEDLSITVGTKTIEEVIAEINAFDPHGTGSVYSAVSNRTDRLSVAASYMDKLAASSFFAAPVLQFSIAYDIVEWCNASNPYCEATWVAGYEPQTYTKTYLSGGATGLTSNISYLQNALKIAARTSAVRVVSGYDDDVNAGAIALSALNAEFATHATNCNKPGKPCRRQVFICNDDITKAAMYATIAAFNNEWMFCVNNRVYTLNETGSKAWLGPHVVAGMAAGIMSGSPVATPLTQKYVNATDSDFLAVDFDTMEDLDFENAIRNGVLFLETIPGTTGGVRFAKGITTYTQLDNDGRRAGEVVEARIRHATVLNRYLMSDIGSKGKGVITASQVQRKVMEAHRAMANVEDPDFILVEGTDEDGITILPYRNIVVSVSGDQVTVRGEVTFTIGVNFIFNDFRATLPIAVVS